VVCLYGHTTSYWLCHFPAPIQPGINTPHDPSTDMLHSPAYEDGTDSEFRNVGGITKKEQITFRTRRKLKNKNSFNSLWRILRKVDQKCRKSVSILFTLLSEVCLALPNEVCPALPSEVCPAFPGEVCPAHASEVCLELPSEVCLALPSEVCLAL